MVFKAQCPRVKKTRLTFPVVVSSGDYGCETRGMISGPVKGDYYYLGHLRLDLLARSSFSLRRQKLLPRGKGHYLPKIFNSTIGYNLYRLILRWS